MLGEMSNGAHITWCQPFNATFKLRNGYLLHYRTLIWAARFFHSRGKRRGLFVEPLRQTQEKCKKVKGIPHHNNYCRHPLMTGCSNIYHRQLKKDRRKRHFSHITRQKNTNILLWLHPHLFNFGFDFLCRTAQCNLLQQVEILHSEFFLLFKWTKDLTWGKNNAVRTRLSQFLSQHVLFTTCQGGC